MHFFAFYWSDYYSIGIGFFIPENIQKDTLFMFLSYLVTKIMTKNVIRMIRRQQSWIWPSTSLVSKDLYVMHEPRPSFHPSTSRQDESSSSRCCRGVQVNVASNLRDRLDRDQFQPDRQPTDSSSVLFLSKLYDSSDLSASDRSVPGFRELGT